MFSNLREAASATKYTHQLLFFLLKQNILHECSLRWYQSDVFWRFEDSTLYFPRNGCLPLVISMSSPRSRQQRTALPVLESKIKKQKHWPEKLVSVVQSQAHPCFIRSVSLVCRDSSDGREGGDLHHLPPESSAQPLHVTGDLVGGYAQRRADHLLVQRDKKNKKKHPISFRVSFLKGQKIIFFPSLTWVRAACWVDTNKSISSFSPLGTAISPWVSM